MAFEKLYLRHHDDTKCFRDVSSLFSHLAARCNFSGLIQFIVSMQLQKKRGKSKENTFSYEHSSFVVEQYFFVSVETREKINKLLICCGKMKKTFGVGGLQNGWETDIPHNWNEFFLSTICVWLISRHKKGRKAENFCSFLTQIVSWKQCASWNESFLAWFMNFWCRKFAIEMVCLIWKRKETTECWKVSKEMKNSD